MRIQRIAKITALLTVMGIAAGDTNSFGALTFTGSSGSLSAEADFSLSGNTLTVTLINTSTADTLVPTDVLTGVFFDASHMTVVSANLNGSSVYYQPIVNNVGEGWQYGNPILGHGMNSGISAAGLGVFGSVPPDQWFYTPPVTPIDGTDYGILSAGDNSATGNTGVTGHGPLIKDSIQFVLTVDSGFSLDDLGNSVVFQYGTALTEPSFDGTTPVPEASTVLAGMLLLLPFGASTLRILRRKRIG